MDLPNTIRKRLKLDDQAAHPDADLLTAFVEAALQGSERDRVYRHLAACSECREVVALSSLDGVPEAAYMPIRLHRRLPMPALRWAAIVACVVVLAAAILSNRKQHGLRTEQQIAMNGSVPTAGAHASEEPSYSNPANAPVAPSESKKSTKPSRALDTIAAAKQSSAGNKGDMAAPSTVAELRAPQAGNLNMQSDAVVPSAPDEQRKAGEAVFTPRPTSETAATTIGGAAKLSDLRSPKWRLSEDGLPERSFTSGQWEKVQVDHRSGFRAFSATGMDVWVGGPGGLLYRSEDMGLNWSRVIPVTSAGSLTDDIVSISFSDHLHGTVRTVSGQTWTTADAGKTWDLR
jgi:hypothetical protein